VRAEGGAEGAGPGCGGEGGDGAVVVGDVDGERAVVEDAELALGWGEGGGGGEKEGEAGEDGEDGEKREEVHRGFRVGGVCSGAVGLEDGLSGGAW